MTPPTMPRPAPSATTRTRLGLYNPRTIVSTTNVITTTNIFSNYGTYYTNIVSTTNVLLRRTSWPLPHQLRNPMNSTNYFTFFTGAPHAGHYTNFSGVVT